MATKDEIIQKYQEDRVKKLLQLQTTLSSRIAQNAKVVASNENNVSVISTTATIDDFISPDRILANLEGQDTQVISDLRENFVRKNSSKDEPFAYLVLSTQVYFQSQTEINIRISENIFLKNPGEEGDGSRIAGVMGITKRESNINSFVDLSKLLSAYSVPIEQLVVNKKFRSYLKNINDKLKSIDSPITVETFPVLVYSTLVVPDGTTTNNYNAAFPKPDGLGGESSPATTGTGTTGTGTGTTETATTETGTGTTETATTETGTGTTTDVGTTTSPQTEQTGSVRKYLSIEAIKDDDPVVPTETTSSRVLSLRYLDDAETSTDRYSSSSEINQIRTDTAQSRSSEPIISPTSEQNKDVLEKESEELRRRTEIQRRSEESDAVVKEETKEKGSTRPVGSDPGLSDGKSAEVDKKNQPIPEDKKPKEKPSRRPVTKNSFDGWMKGKGADPNGIIYRGTDSEFYGPATPLTPNEKPENKDVTFGEKEKRFKNLFNFGTQLEKIFNGYTVESPIDVALLMNSSALGIFNKNWPYMFGEGSEIHLAMITNQTGVLTQKEKGGIGKFDGKETTKDPVTGKKITNIRTDANWGSNPHWCGICTNFMLFSNKKYKSDEKSIDITSTRQAEEEFSKSPFNPDSNTTENEKKKKIKEIDGKIESKKRVKKGYNDVITKKEKEKKPIEGRLNNRLDQLLADTTVTGGDVNSPAISNDNIVKKERALLDGINKEIELRKDDISQIDIQINELNKEKELVQNQSPPKYIESNIVAKFSFKTHWNNSGLTPEGKELYEKIKMWPGAFIVRRTPSLPNGHVETLLHFSPTGELYTIGGNTGLTGSSGNGKHYGFKKYPSIYAFNSDGKFEWFFVVKRGTKNPYTNGIGISVKQTKTYQKYVKDLDMDKEISPIPYNDILRHIMEI